MLMRSGEVPKETEIENEAYELKSSETLERFPRKPRSKARPIRSHSHRIIMLSHTQGIFILKNSGKVPKETDIESEAYKESLP